MIVNISTSCNTILTRYPLYILTYSLLFPIGDKNIETIYRLAYVITACVKRIYIKDTYINNIVL